MPISRRWSFARLTLLAFGALSVAAWLTVLSHDRAAPSAFFSAETLDAALDFLAELAGIDAPGTPAYLQADRWLDMARLAYRTLAMSVLAIGIASIGMLLTVIPAARTAANGELTLSRSRAWPALFLLIRAAYAFSRAVPELIWALLIVFVFSPGILPGALALGLHNFGIVGKLCAEVVEDLDLRPARALRTGGASRAQLLLFAVLPQVLPTFLTFILYRWEVIIRTTIVVGFVSAGGLGREFRLSLSFFHYTDLALILLTYLLLVLAVDAASAGLRRLARE
jgi:phosphonate transport system permease protein